MWSSTLTKEEKMFEMYLLLVINTVLTLGMVAGWLWYIIWKGVLRDTMKQLEEVIEAHNRILAKTFEEK